MNFILYIIKIYIYTNYKEYEYNEKSDDEIYQQAKDQKLKNNKDLGLFVYALWM